ncbi:hypothetical protein RND71_042443 [Anisodus tanguticus]|uniref:Transposase n=1 Tax=Anisodus tanguticus TaxID=243964 RepID=A0AAE1QQN8_9SOLA|nr:hypothetical protein RND71_042443 [Anisodus tanguticus]
MILPEANHRYCVRHIEANWMKRWRSGEMKNLMWWSAWSTYEKDIDDLLRKLGDIDEDVVKDSINYPLQTWLKVMNMLTEHDERVKAWTADFSSHSMRLYSDYLRIVHSCMVHFNGDFGYEVVEGEIDT